MKKIHFMLLLGSFSLVIAGCDLDNSDAEKDENVEDSEGFVGDLETEGEPEEASDHTVSFYAVGDNLIHKQIIDYAEKEDGSYDFKPIYENLTSDIEEADLAYINQESIIGGDDLDFTGYPAFNTPSDMVENLVDLDFDIVNASNNHALDRGSEGVQNTLAYWEDYKDEVLFTGVFNSQEDRDEIPVLEVDDIDFSVLSYTYGTNGIEPDNPYEINYFDRDLITQDVEYAQEESDFLIVSAHWGDEHEFAPNQMQKDYAQLFADLGVDLVVGNHSHTIQPIEWVEGEDGHETLVIYSLGNFVASTTEDFNLLGGSVAMDFVEDSEEEISIDNVHFEPHVIHYEEGVEGDIESRTNFELFKLEDYTDDLAKKHALYDFEDNDISLDYYEGLVDEVIDKEFLE